MINEKGIYSLSAEREDRQYLFTCSNDSPLGELFDVLSEMQVLVIKKMQDIQPKKSTETSEE
jgi:hypothetical protein